MTTFAKTILALIIIVIVAFLGFRFATRPAAAPGQPIEEVVPTQETSPTSASETTYRISQDRSKASFSIREVLRGSPFTAVGTTSQIAGDVTVTDGALALGTIRINARTFKTDSTQRDGAIARFILKSENPESEFITFVPTATTGLQLTEGIEVKGTVTGSLTIAGVTKPVILAVTATQTGNTITGKATSTLKRSDFNLQIPNVPFVASVDDIFSISADIVAVRM